MVFNGFLADRLREDAEIWSVNRPAYASRSAEREIIAPPKEAVEETMHRLLQYFGVQTLSGFCRRL